MTRRAERGRKLRVKSRQPPSKWDILVGDASLFGLALVGGCLLLQTPWALPAWRAWVDLCGGSAPLASALLLHTLPNVLVYYPLSLFYMVLDLWFPTHPWVVSKKVQPVSGASAVQQQTSCRAS